MTAPGWTVKLTKHRSIWQYWTGNPQGGGFGSSADSGQPQYMALAKATRSIPVGESYRLVVNDRDRGVFVKVAVPTFKAVQPWL